MSGDQKERRWFNTEIPLWSVILAAASIAGYLINFDSRMKTVEARTLIYEKTAESAGRMIWQTDAIKDDLSAIRSDIKTLAKLNLDVAIIQNDLAAIECRTGGRCVSRADRGHK